MDYPLTISPDELRRRLSRGIEFIFDLRETDEYDAWRIEGRADFQEINIPQTDFVGNEERYLSALPRELEILTVCAHGDASRYVAGFLRERGFRSVSLEGGMDAWSDYYEYHRAAEFPAVYQIIRSARGCICHLVVSGGQAAVIDPARHTGLIADLAASFGATVSCVLDTHLHADHISGGEDLARRTGAAYYLHPLDAEGGTCMYLPLSDGYVINLGDSVIESIHSPGHTPGSTSFLLNGRFLFTGDTIMKTSGGRPDLGGRADEWSDLLYDTLFSRFGSLRDSVMVMPSHASSIREQDEEGCISATLGACRSHLELFRLRDRAEFAALIRASLPESPDRYQEIRKVNLGLLRPDERKLKQLEIGKNLCGMKQ